MALPIEDIELRQAALAYVIAAYEELTGENGAPTLGTQNQAVDFILAHPERRGAVRNWAAGIGEATTAPPRRLTEDALYRQLREFLAGIGTPAAFGAGPAG